MIKKLVFNNTYKRGNARVLVYKEGSKYVGVCLEFDLVIYGKKLAETVTCIKEMVEGYLANAKENNLPVDVLNRPAPKKYWNKYNEFLKLEQRRLSTTTLSSAVNQKIFQTLVLSQPYMHGRLFA